MELQLATEVDPNVWEDLQTIFSKALFFYIENLRDVWRTVNALELSLPLVVKDNHLDVNLVDFVVLEVVRVLEARLYESLPLHKNTLLGLPNTWEQTQLRTKQIGANYSIIGDPPEIFPAPSSKDELITLINSFSQNNQRHEELLTILLRGLFPNAPWEKVTNSKVFDNMLGWDKHDTTLKVSDESFFDRYFQLRLDATDLTANEISHLANSTSCEYIRQQLHSYDSDKRLTEVIGRISTRTKEGTKVCSFECMAVLLEIGDWPIHSYRNNPLLIIIQGILQSCITRPNQKIGERIANLKTVLETSKSVFWPVCLLSNVAMLVADRSWRGETLPIFEECKVVVSHRIQQQANANILHTHPDIDLIMIFWRQQNEQKLNEWVLKIRDDFPKLISVLKPWERYWIEGGTSRQERVDELLHYFPFVSIAACVNHFYIDNGDDSADLSEEAETAGFYKRHFPRLADSNESQTQ